MRFEAGDRRFAFRLETADAARALLLLLDDYAAAAWAERPPRPRLEKPKRRDSLTALYEGLVAAIIRPPRAAYDAQSLGPTSFEIAEGRVLRRDITLSNVRRERLVASHWAVDDAAKRPCVIFCHANSASRVQAVHYLALLLSLGCSVLALDFAGAGLSEGDVVTLGFREADDIAAAVQFCAATRACPGSRAGARRPEPRRCCSAWRNTTPRSRAASSMDRMQTFGRSRPVWKSTSASGARTTR